MAQLVQVVGAVLILLAYAAAQFSLLDQRSRTYLVLNLLGAVVLTALAWRERQWGFLLLEGVWTLISLWGLIQVTRRRPAAVASALGRGARFAYRLRHGPRLPSDDPLEERPQAEEEGP